MSTEKLAYKYRLHLAAWNGDEETLRQLLQKLSTDDSDDDDDDFDVNNFNDEEYMDLDSSNPLESVDNNGYTPLLCAITAHSMGCVSVLVSQGAELHKAVNSQPIFHIIAHEAAVDKTFATECLLYLLKSDRDTPLVLYDYQNRSLFHICCMYGLIQVLEELLLHTNSPLGNKNTMAQQLDSLGNSCLHLCLQYNSENCLQTTQWIVQHTTTNTEQPSTSSVCKLLVKQNRAGDTPLHTARKVGQKEVLVYLTDLLQQQLRPLAEALSTSTEELVQSLQDIYNMSPLDCLSSCSDDCVRTIIYSHSTFFQHHTSSRTLPETDTTTTTTTPSKPPYCYHSLPPENVNRVHSLVGKDGGLLHSSLLVDKNKLEFVNDQQHEDNTPIGTIADILRVHDYMYIKKVMDCVKKAAEEPTGIYNVDRDTTVSKMSWQATLYSVGCAIQAIDTVFNSTTTTGGGGACRAFVPCRPPGHHCGVSGAVDQHQLQSTVSTTATPNTNTNGFCLVNNVAIAAAYARYKYKGRVAIIDFDVHHGNGTEQIVRCLKPNTTTSSSSIPTGEIKVETTTYKPWLNDKDPEEVLFISLHGFSTADVLNRQDHFYPGTGHTENTVPDQSNAEGEGDNSNDKVNNVRVMNYGMNKEETNIVSRGKWRAALQKEVFPAVYQHQPSVILISAGFDAHICEDISDGFLNLFEEDYEWCTHQLCKIANTVCEGRIVSVLEGGYNIVGGPTSIFSRSVISHVRALQGTAPSMKWDEEVEKNALKRHQTILKALKTQAQQQARPAPTSTAAAAAEDGKDGSATVENSDTVRSKRKRAPVDYKVLNEKLEKEEQEAKKKKLSLQEKSGN